MCQGTSAPWKPKLGKGPTTVYPTVCTRPTEPEASFYIGLIWKEECFNNDPLQFPDQHMFPILIELYMFALESAGNHKEKERKRRESNWNKQCKYKYESESAHTFYVYINDYNRAVEMFPF